MHFKKTGIRAAQGALHIVPGEIRWLLGRAESPGVIRVHDGGVLELEDHTAVPTAATLEGAMGSRLQDRKIEWSACIPIRTRTEVVTLPMAESEVTQAGKWQAQSTFSSLGGSIATDFEVIPCADAPTSPPATQALFVAVSKEDQEQWWRALEALARRPRRLEPSVTALLRALNSLREGDSHQAFGQIVAYRDAGDAALISYRGAHCASVRSYPGAPKESMQPLQGEAGVRAVLETLLHTEDRHPTFAFGELMAMGQLTEDWAQTVARATHLECMDPLTPPFDCPPELVSEQRWIVPYGALLGATP